jgi:superfamily II DNA or RNA helicase
MQLRPRQRVFVDKSVAALEQRGNTLGVAPTGAGKTVMLSATAGAILNQGGSGIILQHRDELVTQNRATFEKVNPRRSTGLFTADRKEWGYDCTFAMVATLANQRNLDGMPPVDFLGIDEGHHAVAPSYLKIIDTQRKRNPNVKLFLVTATPGRGDGRALRAVVDNVSDQISLKELIEARLLVRPRTLVVDIGVQGELAGVRKTVNDFDMTAVEAIMDKQVLNDRIVAEWAKVAGERQTVIFCSTVAHAQHVAETFRQMGYRAACVEGNMTTQERRATLDAYDRGDLQIITNVAVLTEGWDHQPTSCVILLRPSSYKSTMIQMIGRGLRKVEPSRYPGVVKDDCIVMDFGTSILTHGSIEQDIDLEGNGIKDCPECAASVPAQMRECAICGYEWPRDPVDPLAAGGEGGEGGAKQRSELTEFILTEVDLLADSPFRYETLFEGLVSMASGIDAWAAVIAYRGYWHAIGGGKDIGLLHLADNGDRLLAMAAADDFLREHGDADAAKKTKRWLSEPPSDKQLSMLRLQPMQAFGMTKYKATCLIQWKWSERAIKRILEGSAQRLAA